MKGKSRFTSNESAKVLTFSGRRGKARRQEGAGFAAALLLVE
jgi:hypothetical protein